MKGGSLALHPATLKLASGGTSAGEDQVSGATYPLAPASTSAWRPWIEARCAAATAYQEPLTKHPDVLGTVGVLVIPTTADIAPLIGESGEKVDSFRNRSIQVLRLAGLSGFPLVSSPSGQRLGALLGLYLLGPPGSDMGMIWLAPNGLPANAEHTRHRRSWLRAPTR